MKEVIEEHQIDDLKKWMIDFLIKNEELFYVMLSGYKNYEFVDGMFFKIIKDFDDHLEGVTNSISFETISLTEDDKVVVTNCRISIYSKVKNSLGVDGAVVYIQYEDDALWNSVMYLKPNLEVAKEFANIMIESEIGGLNNQIEKMEKLKENINKRF